MIESCPVCDSGEATVLLEADAPVCLAVSGSTPVTDEHFSRLKIVACGRCGHIYNADFDEALLGRIYRDAPLTNIPVDELSISRLSGLAEWLCDEMPDGARVAEIGCGSGYIARLLAKTASEVTVFEPCLQLTDTMLPERNIEIVHDFFGADTALAPADLIVCRHVIEHIPDPRSILNSMRAHLTVGGTTYVEVPDAAYIVANRAVIDFHLPHIHYFHPEHLRFMTKQAGFICADERNLAKSHDFGLKLRPSERPDTSSPPKRSFDPGRLRDEFAGIIGNLRSACEDMPEGIALYGANMHAQALLNTIGLRQRIEACFDDNDRIHGYSLFNRDQRIPVVPVSQDSLRNCPAVLITAYLHEAAISKRLRHLGFAGDIFSIHPETHDAPEVGVCRIWPREASR